MGVLRPVARDMRRQDRLARVIAGGPPAQRWSTATQDDVFGGAWIDPGAYSADLDTFTTAEGNVTASTYSQPASLSTDVHTLAGDGLTLSDDASAGTGAISVQDYEAFRGALVTLAADCGLYVR